MSATNARAMKQPLAKSAIREEAMDDIDLDEDEIEMEKFTQNKMIDANRGLNEKVKGLLIHYIGSLVKWMPAPGALPDHKGKYREEDKVYTPDVKAATRVIKALRAIKYHEKNDTREVTLFIYNQKWVETQLRPLIEFCRNGDYVTAFRCCRLALILTKEIETKVMQVLQNTKKNSKKLTDEGGIPEAEEANDKHKTPTEEKEKSKDKLKQEKMDKYLAVENAKNQLKSLIHMKQILCTENCNESIQNVFRISWEKELLRSDHDKASDTQKPEPPETKQYVASTMQYFNRLLNIEALPEAFNSTEIFAVKRSQALYVSQLKTFLQSVITMCASINQYRGYHNYWLHIIIGILFGVFKELDSKDLFDTWKGKSLPIDKEKDRETSFVSLSNFDSYSNVPRTPNIDKPTPNQRLAITSKPATGLSSMLKSQLNDRLKLTQNSRNSFYNAVYTKKPSIAASPVTATVTATAAAIGGIGGGDDTGSTATGAANSSKIVKNILDSHHPSHEAHSKKNNNHISFLAENISLENITKKVNDTEEGQSALQVAAELMNLFSTYDKDYYPGVRELIAKVNDDRRRGDMLIDNRLELQYFLIVMKCFKFNRLKVNHLQSLHANSSSWEPEIKNIIVGLDRMSLNRCLSSLERLHRVEKNYIDAAIPLELYKEMLYHYLLLLDSCNDVHNDIALAALYRIFYSTSERLDPLHRLIIAWKPGIYPRNYCLQLMETVYATLQLLEKCNEVYRKRTNQSMPMKQSKKSKKKIEIDYEVYVSSCINYDINEYFKRLVAHQSVTLLSMLLKEHKTLDEASLRYTSDFMRRIVHFKLEQPYPAPLAVDSHSCQYSSLENLVPEDQRDGDSDTITKKTPQVTLMYMLFNYRTLNVINAIMQDSILSQYVHYGPLLELCTTVVRQLGIALEKNHLLYVEILFHHAFPHNFCVQLDNVYEAMTYASQLQKMGLYGLDELTALGREESEETVTERDLGGDGERPSMGQSFGSQRNNEPHSDSEKEEEFDETMFVAPQAEEETEETVKPKKKRKKQHIEKNVSWDENGEEAGAPEDQLEADEDLTLSKKHKKTKKRSMKASKKVSSDDIFGDDSDDDIPPPPPLSDPEEDEANDDNDATSQPWTEEEDKSLDKLYSLYIGSKSIFTILANHPDLKVSGHNRSRQSIEKRVQELNLYMTHSQLNFASDSEEEKPSATSATQPMDESSYQHIFGDFSDDDRKAPAPTAVTRRKLIKSNAIESSQTSQMADSDDDIDF